MAAVSDLQNTSQADVITCNKKAWNLPLASSICKLCALIQFLKPTWKLLIHQFKHSCSSFLSLYKQIDTADDVLRFLWNLYWYLTTRSISCKWYFLLTVSNRGNLAHPIWCKFGCGDSPPSMFSRVIVTTFSSCQHNPQGSVENSYLKCSSCRGWWLIS